MQKLTPLLLIWLALLLAGCSTSPNPTGDAPVTPGVSNTPAAPATDTAVPPTPTATPQPLAASVNGEGILLSDYQAELERYRLGNELAELTETDRQHVLDGMVETVLLAQAARAAGFQADDALIDERLAGITARQGSPEALQAWLDAQGYSADSFRSALKLSIEAAWMRDQIAVGVPASAEQVHARQILLYNDSEARNVLASLQNGTDFASLAGLYDPFLQGDLGWFPRGYLLEPAIEEAAFALQPGEFSAVIETQLGYHIVQVLEREDRPLSLDARQQLAVAAIQTWLETQRQSSSIEGTTP